MKLSEATNFSSFLYQLQTLTDDPLAAAAYADGYLASHRGHFPIIEGSTAHFICKKQAGTVVSVGGEWSGWDARQGIMTPIGGGLLHYQHEFELDARLDYFLYEIAANSAQDVPTDWQTFRHLNAHSTLDPLNARTGESGFGPRSELAMPDYERPAITREQGGTQVGTLQRSSMHSKFLGQEHPYTVYLPAGYTTSGEAYPCVYFNDGGDYLAMGKAPTILDNLIGVDIIPPMMAVFMPPVDREGEYNCDDRYVRFLCEELLPELHQHYHLSNEAAQRAVVGPSLGGLISLYIGSERPDLFGLVGAQSACVTSINGLDKYDARKVFASNHRLPLRLYLVIGRYEDCFGLDYRGRCRDLLNPLREFRAVLEEYGYPHRYFEPHQGHSWGLWRDYVPDILRYFFGDCS